MLSHAQSANAVIGKLKLFYYFKLPPMVRPLPIFISIQSANPIHKKSLRTSRPRDLGAPGPRDLVPSGPRDLETSGPRYLEASWPRGSRHRGPEAPRHRGTEGPRSRDPEVWRYRGSEGLEDIEAPRSLGAEVPRPRRPESSNGSRFELEKFGVGWGGSHQSASLVPRRCSPRAPTRACVRATHLRLCAQ